MIDGAKLDGRANMLDDRVKFQKKSLGRPAQWTESNKIKKGRRDKSKAAFRSEANWRKTG